MTQTEVMQTEAPAVGAAADPAACDSFFMLPPGLHLSDAADNLGPAAAKIDGLLGNLYDGREREEVIAALGEAVMLKVEARVAQKTQELWARARQFVNQMQEKHQDTNSKLQEDLARCQERQQALQAENETLRQGIQDLSARFSLLKQAWGGEDVNTAVVGAFAETGTSPMSPAQASPEFLTPGAFPSASCEAGFASPVALDPANAELAAVAGMDCLWHGAKLPELPAFPFPSPAVPAQQLQQPRTPLSLADALDSEAPMQPAPCAFPEAMPPPPPGVAPLMDGDYSYMMSEADASQEQALAAAAAWSDGSMQAWGEQWGGSAPAEQAEPFASSTTSTMRADACVFVPWSAGPPTQAPRHEEG